MHSRSWNFSVKNGVVSFLSRLFSIACKIKLHMVCYVIPWNLISILMQHGLVGHFIGVNVVPNGNHFTLHVETYFKRIFQNNGWTHLMLASLPMNLSRDFFYSLDIASFCLWMTRTISTSHF